MQDIGHKELIHFATCVIIKEELQKDDILMYIETFFGLEDDNNDV